MSNRREPHAFFSYHPGDQPEAEEMARRLRDQHGIQVWLRAWSLVPGRLTQEEQERGLAESDACAVLIGGQGVRDWQQLEVYASVARRVEERGSDFPVIPVYLPGHPPGVRGAVPAFLELYEPVIFAALDDEEALRRLACGILGTPPGEEAPADLPCPYPGLRPFHSGEAAYFCGRDAEIAELQGLLEDGPFVLVIGPSGSGKSSLVKAGLLPRLEGTPAAPSPYRIDTLTPGREPLHSLAMLFVSGPGDPRRDRLVDALARDERELSRAVQARLSGQPEHVERILFFVDQFEQVFALCDNPDQQSAFIRNLLCACQDCDARARVVFTLRSDFFTQCFRYDALVDGRRQLQVPPLRGQRLRQAIEDPARRAGLLFERGLVETLLDDAGEQPGILPLVQYTLREIYDRRNGRWLTRQAYDALGSDVDPQLRGVRGAIASRAEKAIDKLQKHPHFDASQVEPIVRRIFLRLVQVGENSPPTRQQVRRADFFWASDTTEQQALLDKALDLLIDERLLTIDGDQVNLAHDAVITAWGRLSGWVARYSSDLLIRRRIEEDAREWERSGKEESRLYRGGQLQEALSWQERRI